MSKFTKGQKVTLVIGNLKFQRTVAQVWDGAVYLEEGGDAFNASNGYVYGSTKSTKHIIAK